MTTANTKIQWTDRTWNPTRGCRRVSPGCEACYAERQAYRFSGAGQPYEGLVELGRNGPRWTGRGRLVPKTLAEPLSWRKPERVFVDSMSDLFFEGFSNREIAAVFGVMAACPHLTFQVLTKRARRMREWFEWALAETSGRFFGPAIAEIGARHLASIGENVDALYRAANRAVGRDAPLANVWLGVSVENHAHAADRIPDLLCTPAAVRFVSYEPALGSVDFRAIPANLRPTTGSAGDYFCSLSGLDYDPQAHEWTARATYPHLNWVIVGGESGPNARPFDLAWARMTVAQCRAAGVACFVKQLGACASDPENGIAGAALKVHPDAAELVSQRLHDKKGGDMAEWPEDLRVREFPTTASSRHTVANSHHEGG